KRSALRDVAGMLRSFDYAPYAVIFGQTQSSVIRSEDVAVLETAARFWVRSVRTAFLQSYLAESGNAPHLPRTREEIDVLLRLHLLEKAVYEITYELSHRPDWVRIPIHGVMELIVT